MNSGILDFKYLIPFIYRLTLAYTGQDKKAKLCSYKKLTF